MIVKYKINVETGYIKLIHVIYRLDENIYRDFIDNKSRKHECINEKLKFIPQLVGKDCNCGFDSLI